MHHFPGKLQVRQATMQGCPLWYSRAAMNLAGRRVEILLPRTVSHKCSALLELFHHYLFPRFRRNTSVAEHALYPGVTFVLAFSRIATVVEDDVIAAIRSMINEHSGFK